LGQEEVDFQVKEDDARPLGALQALRQSDGAKGA